MCRKSFASIHVILKHLEFFLIKLTFVNVCLMVVQSLDDTVLTFHSNFTLIFASNWSTTTVSISRIEISKTNAIERFLYRLSR